MSDDPERVYVLRLRDEAGPPHRQHISLYDTVSGLRIYFSTLEALQRHLRRQLNPEDEPPPGAPHLKS